MTPSLSGPVSLSTCAFYRCLAPGSILHIAAAGKCSRPRGPPLPPSLHRLPRPRVGRHSPDVGGTRLGRGGSARAQAPFRLNFGSQGGWSSRPNLTTMALSITDIDAALSAWPLTATATRSPRSCAPSSARSTASRCACCTTGRTPRTHPGGAHPHRHPAGAVPRRVGLLDLGLPDRGAPGARLPRAASPPPRGSPARRSPPICSTVSTPARPNAPRTRSSITSSSCSAAARCSSVSTAITGSRSCWATSWRCRRARGPRSSASSGRPSASGSRAPRAALTEFLSGCCGVVNPDAACRCHRRLGKALALGRVRPDDLETDRGGVAELRSQLANIQQLVRVTTFYRDEPAAVSKRDFVATVRALLSLGPQPEDP